MIPITKLLSKIKWDEKENQEDYEIGYLDRVRDIMIKVPVSDIELDDKFSFKKYDNMGREHEIPFHRIKVVWKKNNKVCERK